MDLRTMLNEGSGPARAAGAPAAARPPPPPPARPGSQHQHQHQHQQQYHQQPPQQHPMPSTPVQTVAPQSFRDHPPSVQPSPARSMSRDYHPGQGTPFGSPPAHPASTPYAPGRPQPPPLPHLAGTHDMRSPSAGPPPAQSPYARTTPAASVRPDSGGAYPFPRPGHPHPDSTASPIQQHRYPPSGNYPLMDGYSQVTGPIAGTFPGMPQMAPVGAPGEPHPYLTQQHQRSASAQSHHSYPPNQPYASPIITNHPPPPPDQTRQPSQPPTPHGNPLSAAPRQASGAGTFAQPSSPYQPRNSSSGPPHPLYPPQHPVQHPPPPLHPQQQQQQQSSPHITPGQQPSPHRSIQRKPSGYEQPPIHSHAVDPHRTSLSRSERERSVSVSPKTRVPSLPSSTGHLSQASLSGPSGQPAEFDPRDPHQLPPNIVHMRDAPGKLEREAPHAPATRAERASTPAKRKMDDRDIKPEDLDRQEPRPAPFQSNGAPRPGSSSRPHATHQSDSPMPPRRRRRHAAPPNWALAYEKQQLSHPNYQLRKHAVGPSQVNGAADPNTGARQERAVSRHVSPEASRSNPPGPPPNHSAPGPAMASVPQLLGPWETTIDNKAPFDEVCKAVADFLLFNVVLPPQFADVHGRPGYQFEVEAKLGHLVDRNAREPGRIQLPVRTEVVLAEDERNTFAFSSNMSETQHKLYNEFLNLLVTDSSPQNPKNINSANPRVPVNYVHTREIDRFFRLPADAREHIHPALRQLMRKDASIRVTTDRSGRPVAKIVKVQIANMHIFLPMCDLDCRISVNVEIDFPGPVEGLEQIMQDGAGFRGDRPDRHKDRLTYTQGLYRVDLTQVTQPDAAVQAKEKPKTHELEIELNAEALIDQGRRALADQPHNYDFLIEGFVNNIRMLARKARQLEREAAEKAARKAQQAQHHQHQ